VQEKIYPVIDFPPTVAWKMGELGQQTGGDPTLFLLDDKVCYRAAHWGLALGLEAHNRRIA
jgi:hypothetical protein